ncbi:ABC transporter family substrate-binding protein [Streptacidiphilus carbonis]|uniref:ABC transporter family substrate-binding protein n=1 Tax=Streptacidiphilus carbonis TaxID=105422 RepID=UPI0006936322|nr:ABC transporter family substrate-binding protein [Streptacidiphilus carbonis]
MPQSPARPYGTLAVVGAAALGVVLAACSGGGPAPKASDLSSAARAEVRTGGTLRWALDAAPTTLNTFQADATPDTALLAEAVLPTLFTLDQHATASPDPDYLTGAEQTSQQPQTVVYHLNPKAVWSDGTPLSAADFAAQWRALNGRSSAYWTARTDGYDAIASVGQGAGPHDVKVVFARPYAAWKGLFTPLYPAAATSTPDAFNDGSHTRLAADAGPFTLTGVKDLKALNGGAVTAVRNPHWWGAPAKLDAIAFTPSAPDARVADLRAGRLDVADLSRAVEDGTPVGQAASVPGTVLHRASAPAFLQLTLNGGSGPLADPDLRRAVAQAVDRTAIAETVLKPLGLPVLPLGNHLVMADQHGYEDDSSALAPGADNATRHLDAAGWRLAQTPAGDAAHQAPSTTPVRTKDGRTLGLTLLTRTGSAEDAQVARVLTAQLAKVGIPLRTVTVAGDSFFADHVAAGSFDLALFSWPAARFPVADELPLYAKPSVEADGSLNNGQNLAATGTDEVDQLLTRAASALDPAQAARLTTEADTRIWQEAPSLPLFQRPELVAVRTDVANAGAFGFTAPHFQDLGFTSRH